MNENKQARGNGYLNKLRFMFLATDPGQRRSAGNIFKFMILLLAFTLIARGSSGATLARVDIETPIRSEIIDAVSGSATVSTIGESSIMIPSGLTVAEMLIGTGQHIAAGDALVTFAMEEIIERHIRETASLSRMSLDLDRLERSESADDGPLETALRNLSRARDDYNAALRQGQDEINTAREALELLNGGAVYMFPAVIRNYQRASEDFYAVLEQSQADIMAAETAALEIDDTALQNAVRNHLRAIDDYEAAVAQGVADIASAQAALYELLALRPADRDRTAIENAQRALTRAREDYDAGAAQGEENIQNAQDALDRAWSVLIASSAPQTPDNPLWAEVERAQNPLETVQNTSETSRLNARRRVEDAQASLMQAQRLFDESIQGDIERAEAALETAQTRAADNSSTALRRLEDAEISLAQAQRNFENSITSAQSAVESAHNRANDNIQAATRRLEDAASSAETETERAEAALQTAINRAEESAQSAARRVEDALASLSVAEETHRRNMEQNTEAAVQNTISATTLRLDLSEQQTVVDRLDELIMSNGVLYAEYGGVVSQAAQQGAITGNTPVIVLRDTSGGFEAQMVIPGANAERLTIGSEAEVTTGGGSVFFTPTTIGVVSAVSLPDDSGNVTVTIALPGTNWNVGQRIDSQVILHRANYDMSVPISAVNSDNAGYFLHVMEQRNTVLGLQNIARRVNITIVAADSDMAAIRGPVNRDSQVIVGSSRAISTGDRVRIVE